jgi:hydrogenase maturation protease
LTEKTLICSFGNVLRADDGVGACVIEELGKRSLPDWVGLRDFGTSGFRAAVEMGDYDRVIVIDALAAGHRPGTIYRLVLGRKDAIAGLPPGPFAVSLHEVGLDGALATAALIGRFPAQVIVMGCEPGDMSMGLARSEAVAHAVEGLVELVLSEIEGNRVKATGT